MVQGDLSFLLLHSLHIKEAMKYLGLWSLQLVCDTVMEAVRLQQSRRSWSQGGAQHV